jgi:DNA repair protein RadC
MKALVDMKSVSVVKVYLVKEGSVKYGGVVANALDVAAMARQFIGPVDREHCVVICLDNKHRPTAIHTVSVGSLTMSIVHPREVYKAAVLSSAAAVILVHNHPSGDPAPSAEDRALTVRLVAAGEALGIQILDHVIVGDDEKYYSFADRGMMKGAA